MTSYDYISTGVRFGFREFAAANPWWIRLTTNWPRAVLQCLFFTLLGRLTGGTAGGDFAFVGSVAMMIALGTVGGVGDVPGIEKLVGTFHRLQLSGVSLTGLFALRSIPWIGEGLVDAVLALAMVGPLTGHGRLALRLLPLLPLFLLSAVACAAAGLAAASPAIGRRADVIVSNGLIYLIIATGGLLVPAGRAPLLDAIGAVMPVRHALLAVRYHLAGHPWLREAVLEVVVAVGWGLLAVALYRRQGRRARTDGTDDFA